MSGFTLTPAYNSRFAACRQTYDDSAVYTAFPLRFSTLETTRSACGLACFVHCGKAKGMLRTSLPRPRSLNQPFLEDLSLQSRSYVRLCGYKGDFALTELVRRQETTPAQLGRRCCSSKNSNTSVTQLHQDPWL